MSVRSHHWSLDRYGRVSRLLKFIEDHPGVDERTIMRVMTKLLKVSPRAIREYLSELEYQDEIQKHGDKFYVAGYEGKQAKAGKVVD